MKSIYIGEERYPFKEKVQQKNFIQALKSTCAREGDEFLVEGDDVVVRYHSWVDKEGKDRLYCQYRYHKAQ